MKPEFIPTKHFFGTKTFLNQNIFQTQNFFRTQIFFDQKRSNLVLWYKPTKPKSFEPKTFKAEHFRPKSYLKVTKKPNVGSLVKSNIKSPRRMENLPPTLALYIPYSKSAILGKDLVSMIYF